MTNHVTKGDLCASIGMAPFVDQLDIFTAPPASRRNDAPTAKIAGRRFEGKTLSELHQRVLAAFRINGQLTDETLERLPVFASCAPSTVRKRRSELFQRWHLVEYGMVTNSRGSAMVIWALAPWDAAEAARRFKDLGKQELRRESA